MAGKFIQEEASISIGIAELVNSVRSKLSKQTELLSFSCSISRVIRSLREYNEDAYNPQLVSIGPYHRGKDELRAFEQHKWRYLRDSFSRNPSCSLETYIEAVKMLAARARSCYSQVIELDSKSFVEMMLLDGCFIVELFRKTWLKMHGENQHSSDDPLLELKLLRKAVMADLVMIENQIPFFILERLFELTNGPRSTPHLEEIALYCLKEFNSTNESNFHHINGRNIQHLLHLVHLTHIPTNEEFGALSTLLVPRVFKRIPCASKLEEGGVEFRVRKRNDRGSFMDIKFDNGVLEIPPIEVWNKTYILFLNLIAFEQCNSDSRKFISAYTAFMDCLINTSKDVEILCQKGIIDNGLGNEKRVADLFNHMGRELTVYDKDFYLSGVCQEINQYSEKCWSRMRAFLVHDYFKKPWAIISFIGANFLLFLTTTQTFFSAFPKFAYG